MSPFVFLALVMPANGYYLQPLNSTELGKCFAPYVYSLVVNAASSAEMIAMQQINRTVISVGGGDDGQMGLGDFRIELELGNKVVTIITLFVIGGVAILLLTAGEKLINTVAVVTSVLVSFMASLYLWQWACSSTVVPMEGFVKCILPFILACVSALLIGLTVICLIRKVTSLVFFIMGAAGGALGMFLLRQFILAGNPHLALNSWFNFYWLGLAVVALITGILAVVLKKSVIRIVTCLLGGYSFAVALCGLIPAFGGPYCANYVFFIVAFAAMGLGLAFQCFCCRGGNDEQRKQRQEQYRVDREERKRQQKATKGVQMQNQGFIAP